MQLFTDSFHAHITPQSASLRFLKWGLEISWPPFDLQKGEEKKGFSLYSCLCLSCQSFVLVEAEGNSAAAGSIGSSGMFVTCGNSALSKTEQGLCQSEKGMHSSRDSKQMVPITIKNSEGASKWESKLWTD